MDTKKKKEFVRPRVVRRKEKLASIVQFATGGTASKKEASSSK
jgi:hypothetical protein